MRAGRICSFTTHDDLRITIDEQSFRFEWSDQFGPLMLGKNGQPRQTMPGPRSVFWKALKWWMTQGKRIEHGVAVYEPVVPKRTRWLQIDRRNLVQDTPTHRAEFPWATPVELEEEI